MFAQIHRRSIWLLVWGNGEVEAELILVFGKIEAEFDDFGINLGRFGDEFGMILGRFWDDFLR